MKKIFCMMVAAVLALSTAAFAQDTSALDAFNALTGQQAQLGNPEKSNAEYLAEIMEGVYEQIPADHEAAALMAAELQYLTGITNRDIASFASANSYQMAQVRNAYFIALANVLRAEIMVNPASEERYRDVQLILSLFLEWDEAKIDHASREAIRKDMTPESAAVIADEYNLPAAFVAFVIMDDDWEDDLWDNDDDWLDAIDWDDSYDDSDRELVLGDRDTAESTLIAEMQERLIALGYLTGKADGVFGASTQKALIQYQLANGEKPDGKMELDDLDDMYDDDVVARWDYQDSFDYVDSPDDTPDAADSVDYDNSPDNTPDAADSVDYDNSPDDTPDAADSVDYDNSPDNTPDAADSVDYDNSPDDTPDAVDSVDYDDTPDAEDSVDYEDS